MPPLSRRQAVVLGGLGVVVLAAHLWLAGSVLLPQLGEGAGEGSPRRMEVSFVRELEQVQPVAEAAPAPKPTPAARRAAPVATIASAAAAATAASAPSVAADTPQPAALPLAQAEPASAPVPDVIPAAPLQPASEAVASASSAPTAAAQPPPAVAATRPFDWPPSTRLSYTLTGNVRGPVQGQAQVEWLRSGTRYQVFMEVSVGPSFAPLMSRHSSSEGEITPEGLSPRRYDEETKAVLRSPRRLTVHLDADRVRLADGREVPRPAKVQDSASQFVHLTWLFTTQPEWLTPGRSIELPLALPRRVQPWIYDVIGPETLHTPFGVIETVHVKPRREETRERPGGDLAVEFWVAPSLQYLPVRMLIRQDGDNYIDLLVERLPQQAAAAASASR